MVFSAHRSDVESLYRHHHGWLRGWLKGRLGDAWTAADIAHDTFVRLLHPDRTQPIIEPRALLRHIARGLVVDHWRRQDIEQAYLEALANHPPSHAPSAEATRLIIDLLVKVDVMLNSLPPRTREVFLLAQVDGLTLAAIGERCRMPVITVRRHIQRALVSCMQVLEGDAP